MKPVASVVVTTHDRDEELAVCLSSLRRQTVPLDVIVMDDKPGVDTMRIVASEYPEARYVHIASSRGPAFQRNRGVEAAKCDIVISLDDDVELLDPSSIEKTLFDFKDPEVAVVGIPFVNVRLSDEVQHVSGSPDRLLHSFVGCSHAVRRTTFIKAGGFRDHFFYMGEEGDLAVRLYNMGYLVKAGLAPPIHHFESPRRSSKRAANCGRKNDVLFAMHNVPHPFFIPHLFATVVNGIKFGFIHGNLSWHLEGLKMGFKQAWEHREQRHPVSIKTYLKFRELKRQNAGQAIAWAPPK